MFADSRSVTVVEVQGMDTAFLWFAQSAAWLVWRICQLCFSAAR